MQIKCRESGEVTHTNSGRISGSFGPYTYTKSTRWLSSYAVVLALCLIYDELNLDGATYKAKSFLGGGGVGRNIAEGLYKLYGDVRLISAIGNDESGNSLNSYLPAAATTGVIRDSQNTTSICAVICDKLGDCQLVLGDMKIHSCITPELIMQNEDAISKAPLIVMDANIDVRTMETLLSVARKHNKPVFFEPTDMRIADKPFSLHRSLTKQIKFISPNIYELQKISQILNPATNFADINISMNSDTLRVAKRIAASVIDDFDTIIVTLGPAGVLVATKATGGYFFNNRKTYEIERGSVKYRHYTAPKVRNVVNVSGAGDSFTSGFISAMLSGAPEETCVAVGFKAAECALLAESAVPSQYFQNEDEKKAWYALKASPADC